MSYAMTKADRERFLAETHVAIVTVAEPGRGPLAAPVWYEYRPGEVIRFVTGASSKKAKLIRAAGRISLCAQTETPPYKYVTVEGPVEIGEPDYERDVRAMALRYLGDAMGGAYLKATAADYAAEPQLLITLRPERWNTVDFSSFPGL